MKVLFLVEALKKEGRPRKNAPIITSIFHSHSRWEVWMMTTCSREMFHLTRSWLRRHDFQYDHLVRVTDPEKFIKELSPDLVVMDEDEDLTRLLEET